MWIHEGKKIAFVANPRTASREICYEILQPRGFRRFLGHHGVPWGPDYPRPKHYVKQGELWWWYTENPMDWTWVAAHRNHFEVFHSLAYAVLGGNPPSPERFTDYLWKHPFLYRNEGVLFPSFWEIRHCVELRYDFLRIDLDLFLASHGLPGIKPHEFHRGETKHVTPGKPRDEHYSAKLDATCRAWIEDRYGLEMQRFGYRWEEPEPNEYGSDGESHDGGDDGGDGDRADVPRQDQG